MKRRPDKSLLIGDSPEMVALRELIGALADSSSAVLVTGESGTGKELVARELHNTSDRALSPFVPINCGAIPKELIESELFGHRKGSFTGALVDRKGRFELAHGGTLFLDEIGDLPLDMQVKLLRVLQERSVLPVGASHEVAVDVRIVAATHRKLEDEVAQGRFREDLYYRINVLPITTSPLRERPLDTETLMAYYSEKFARPGVLPVRYKPAMANLLKEYSWPGNVRELSNLVDRFTTLFPGQEIDVTDVPSCMLPPGLALLQSERLSGETKQPVASLHDILVQKKLGQDALLPGSPVASSNGTGRVPALETPNAGHGDQHGVASVAARNSTAEAASPAEELNPVEQVVLLAQGIGQLPPEGFSLKQHMVDIEKSLIEQALRMKDGNVSQTARVLQLQRTTLIEKINKYDLRVDSQ